MNEFKRWVWPIGLGMTLALALCYALWPRPVAVEIVTATEGPMVVTLEDDGITRVKEVYSVSAPIAGRMLRLEIHPGDPIEAGNTVIALIEPADPAFRDSRAQRELELTVDAARAARDVADANLKGREADLELARLEVARDRQLYATGVLAKASLDRAEAEMAVIDSAHATARAALRQRDFELRTAEASLIRPSDPVAAKKSHQSHFVIRAPITGVILRLLHENEGVVQVGQPLAEIGDPSSLEIVVDLLSSDAVQVAAGDAAIVTRWGGEGALDGRVRRIEPVGSTKVSSLGIEEQRVNVIIDLTDPPKIWRRLGHGYQLDVAIVRWSSPKVLRLPVGALFRAGEDWAAFRVEAGRARQIGIEIGEINDEVAEVLRGLRAGDRLVSHPGEKVADGVAVVSR